MAVCPVIMGRDAGNLDIPVPDAKHAWPAEIPFWAERNALMGVTLPHR